MEETITVKVEDLQNLWKEIDDLYTDIIELEEKSCKMVGSTQLENIQELSIDIHNSRKAVKGMLGITRKLLGMKE